MTERVMLSSLRVDLEREKKGDWVPYPLWGGKVRFNVSALTLPAYETARDLMYKRLAKEYPDGIPKDVLLVELGALYHEHILHDWDGLDVTYSPDVARATLTNAEYRAVISAVEWCAAKLSDVDVKFTKAEEGNSSPPSEPA